MKLTKHGLRDLNSKGYNGRRHGSDELCSHNFKEGEVIGTDLVETGIGIDIERPVLGKKCLWCGEKRP